MRVGRSLLAPCFNSKGYLEIKRVTFQSTTESWVINRWKLFTKTFYVPLIIWRCERLCWRNVRKVHRFFVRLTLLNVIHTGRSDDLSNLIARGRSRLIFTVIKIHFVLLFSYDAEFRRSKYALIGRHFIAQRWPSINCLFYVSVDKYEHSQTCQQ